MVQSLAPFSPGFAGRRAGDEALRKCRANRCRRMIDCPSPPAPHPPDYLQSIRCCSEEPSPAATASDPPARGRVRHLCRYQCPEGDVRCVDTNVRNGSVTEAMTNRRLGKPDDLQDCGGPTSVARPHRPACGHHRRFASSGSAVLP